MFNTAKFSFMVLFCFVWTMLGNGIYSAIKGDLSSFFVAMGVGHLLTTTLSFMTCWESPHEI